MRTFAQRQRKTKKVTVAAIGRRKPAAAESTEHKHPVLRLQHTLGNRATRQILLARAQELDGRKVLALAPDASKPAPTAATGDQSHVPTNWFLDFWGVGSSRGQKGRGDRQEGDVAVVDHFTVGPKDEAQEFEHAGNALAAGYSHLGTINHRKGRGSATGTVSYAKQKDIEAKLIFSEKADKKVVAAAKAAAQKKVEDLIFRRTDVSGNWSEVERQAAAAAAELLPEGSDPKVEITLKGQHQRVPLDTVDYDVQNPSLCTAKITVPTTTQSVGWSRTDTQEKAKKSEAASAEKTHVEVDVGGSKAHTESKSSSDVEAKAESRTDTSAEHKATKTHTEAEYGITLTDIEANTRIIADHIVSSIGTTWTTVTNQLKDQKGGGDVPGATSDEPSTAGKIWNWLKDRGKSALGWAKDKVVGAVVDKAKKLFKDKVIGYLLKGLEMDSPWFLLANWGVDYLVDKLRGTAHARKDADQTGPQRPTQVVAIQNFAQLVTESSTAVKEETYNGLLEQFRASYKHDEESSKDKGSIQSGSSASVKASGSSSADTQAGHAEVKSTSDSQKSKDESQEEHATTSRTYYGTTVSVIAGHPVLQVTVENQS
jgi:hypothetical protein